MTFGVRKQVSLQHVLLRLSNSLVWQAERAFQLGPQPPPRRTCASYTSGLICATIAVPRFTLHARTHQPCATVRSQVQREQRV
jgi:hypothetical protein